VSARLRRPGPSNAEPKRVDPLADPASMFFFTEVQLGPPCSVSISSSALAPVPRVQLVRRFRAGQTRSPIKDDRGSNDQWCDQVATDLDLVANLKRQGGTSFRGPLVRWPVPHPSDAPQP